MSKLQPLYIDVFVGGRFYCQLKYDEYSKDAV